MNFHSGLRHGFNGLQNFFHTITKYQLAIKFINRYLIIRQNRHSIIMTESLGDRLYTFTGKVYHPLHPASIFIGIH